MSVITDNVTAEFPHSSLEKQWEPPSLVGCVFCVDVVLLGMVIPAGVIF